LSENVYEWSTTAATNATADGAINWAENQLPGTVNGSARSMMAAFAKFLADINGTLSTGGSSNAYTIASPNTTYSALASGIVIGFKANHTNTGASTLNLSSLGAKDIKYFPSSGSEADVLPGQIVQNGHYTVEYDASADGANGAWILKNPSPDALPGEIRLYGGTTAPTGWLLCYGHTVSRTTYAALFAVIGTTFGAGDGSTTFALPDFRGRAPFGQDDMGGSAAGRLTTAGSGVDGATLGASGGAQTVTLSTSEIPSHTHTGTTASSGSHNHTTSVDGDHTHTFSGTSSTESAGHTHRVSGTTSGHSSDHTHAISITSQGQSTSHTHAMTTNRLFKAFTAGASTSDTFLADDAGSDNIGTTGAASSDHTHLVSGTSAGASADHTHTYSTTSGGVSATHTHTYSGSTSGVSATHTHTISSDGAHTHTITTDATGGGGAHNNVPPALVVNFIIRT
jgi:microcystin-dependent protein